MIKILPDENEDYVSIANCAFDRLGLCGEAYVELIFMDEAEIHTLNLQTRGVDRATDVLSYPNLDEIKPFTFENYPFDYDNELSSVFLGSIVICEPIALKQSEEYGHSFKREKSYLFLHGLLHLLGYDHEKDDDKFRMRQAEEDILISLGVNR